MEAPQESRRFWRASQRGGVRAQILLAFSLADVVLKGLGTEREPPRRNAILKHVRSRVWFADENNPDVAHEEVSRVKTAPLVLQMVEVLNRNPFRKNCTSGLDRRGSLRAVEAVPVQVLEKSVFTRSGLGHSTDERLDCRESDYRTD